MPYIESELDEINRHYRSFKGAVTKQRLNYFLRAHEKILDNILTDKNVEYNLNKLARLCEGLEDAKKIARAISFARMPAQQPILPQTKEEKPEIGTIYGYTRISTDETKQATSLPQQADRIAKAFTYKWADNPKLQAGEVFSEQISGTVHLFKRPEGGKLNDLLKPGDYLVVAKLDRAFRSVADGAPTLEELNYRGVWFCALDYEIDTSTPYGMAFVQMGLVWAELERRIISDRTKATYEYRKSMGYATCKPPKGWKIAKVREGRKTVKKYVVDKVERERSRYFLEQYEAGVSYAKLAVHARCEGWMVTNTNKRPFPWTWSRIREVVMACRKGFPMRPGEGVDLRSSKGLEPIPDIDTIITPDDDTLLE